MVRFNFPMARKASHTKIDEKIEVGSGNVFADLGVRNAAERLAKAKLATKFARSIEKLGLNQNQISEQSGLKPCEIYCLLRGQLTGFSTRRLIAVVNRLG
jgi:predicted XRE-type DNA-binding protein